jgi:hypothetical protein
MLLHVECTIVPLVIAAVLHFQGAKVNASNNAGDTPWHAASHMGHTDVVALLEKVGGRVEGGLPVTPQLCTRVQAAEVFGRLGIEALPR